MNTRRRLAAVAQLVTARAKVGGVAAWQLSAWQIPPILVFGLCVWMANREVCPACLIEDAEIVLDDGTLIAARLYRPQTQGTVPGVVVSHGYLADLAFMEIPWAADLTRLGVAGLFIDRRGHGRSGGHWWPRDNRPTRFADTELDVRAAIEHLRSHPGIDPERVGLLGHSDGATAALVAASLDWRVVATVAFSASVAPWQLVNHFVPKNLLLLYGTKDRFVLNDTDRMLIRQATRGYLDGPGTFGNPADGSARRLVALPGHGHVDLIRSEAARRLALEWLQQTLKARGEVVLSSVHEGWLWGGFGALLLTLAAPRFAKLRHGPGSALHRAEVGNVYEDRGAYEPHAAPLAAALVICWALGMLLGQAFAGRLSFVPGQEGSVVAGLLVGEAGVLALLAAVIPFARRRADGRTISSKSGDSGGPQQPTPTVEPRRSDLLQIASRGLVFGVALALALQVLVLHFHQMALDRSRLGLFVYYGCLALPAFWLLERSLRWLDHSTSTLAGSAVLLVLAALTAVVGTVLYERMSVLPAYLMAGTLTLWAADRASQGGRMTWSSGILAAVVFARSLSTTCALY